MPCRSIPAAPRLLLHLLPPALQDVRSPDLVVQRVKSSSGLSLGRPVQRSLKGSNSIFFSGGTSHLALTQSLPSQKRVNDVGVLPSPPVVLSGNRRLRLLIAGEGRRVCFRQSLMDGSRLLRGRGERGRGDSSLVSFAFGMNRRAFELHDPHTELHDSAAHPATYRHLQRGCVRPAPGSVMVALQGHGFRADRH